MQSLSRVAQRQFFDLILTTRFSKRSLKSGGPLLRISTYPQFRLRNQMRQLVEGNKLYRISKPTPNKAQSSFKSNDATTCSEQDSDLPSKEASRRLALTKNFSHLMDRLQGNIFTASQRINDITGYSGIEALKNRITALESNLEEAQNAVRTARLKYKTTVADRASSQREVTTLLARKDSWSPCDLERFTALYRMDHSNEQAVQEAATRLADAEREVEHSSSQLRNCILSRYHEEQIWSDKIRRMSTWGTWGLMGVNVLLFFTFQFGFEPWRRKRLIEGFERKVLEALELEKNSRVTEDKNRDLASSITSVNDTQNLDLETGNEGTLAESTTPTEVAKMPVESPNCAGVMDVAEISFPKTITNFTESKTLALYAANLTDLFSDRIIEIRKQDIMIIALNSAIIGATLATTIFFSFFSRSLF